MPADTQSVPGTRTWRITGLAEADDGNATTTATDAINPSTPASETPRFDNPPDSLMPRWCAPPPRTTMAKRGHEAGARGQVASTSQPTPDPARVVGVGRPELRFEIAFLGHHGAPCEQRPLQGQRDQRPQRGRHE
jgi:hypothetical protein